ncbi:MAG: RNA-binding protein [Sphingobacteriales bacterium]|nr:MAG: RNA-binding protein [Sphingobacteriales bacterium]
MAKKLYVGNLPFSCTDADLSQAFTQFGNVASARVVTDRETGRSKGFGFVEMSNDEEAKKAIAELDQAEVDGRTISVAEAKPREQRPERKSFGGGGGGNRGGGGGYGGGGNKFNKRY